MQKLENTYVEVGKSGIHSFGLFARQDIMKGTEIIEYVGEKLNKEESDKRAEEYLDRAEKDGTLGSVYIFELNEEFDIDGNVEWNAARLINHSCDPNCEVEIDGYEIWINALRDIKKGEELSYNYGYDLEDYQDHPCNCKSERCVGYMLDEEHWGKIKKC